MEIIATADNNEVQIRDFLPVKKGDIREIIKIAGIQGAKETPGRVIFAHPIPKRVNAGVVSRNTACFSNDVGLTNSLLQNRLK